MKRAIHFVDRLHVDLRASTRPALVMVRASVRAHPFTGTGRVLDPDRLAAVLVGHEATQHVLGRGAGRHWTSLAGLVRLQGDQLLHRVPRGLVDDPPLGNLCADDLCRIGLARTALSSATTMTGRAWTTRSRR